MNDGIPVAKKPVLDWAEQCSSPQLYSQGVRESLRLQPAGDEKMSHDSLPGREGGGGGQRPGGTSCSLPASHVPGVS